MEHVSYSQKYRLWNASCGQYCICIRTECNTLKLLIWYHIMYVDIVHILMRICEPVKLIDSCWIINLVQLKVFLIGHSTGKIRNCFEITIQALDIEKKFVSFYRPSYYSAMSMTIRADRKGPLINYTYNTITIHLSHLFYLSAHKHVFDKI